MTDMPKLKLTLEHTSEDRELMLGANDLHELIEKMKHWNDWESEVGSPDAFIRRTKRFQADPEGEEQIERDSGWYWFGE